MKGTRGHAVILAALCAAAAAETLPIRAYTIADGLAADSVYRVLADSRGFLWFGTDEGLSRFDGYRFVNYGPAQGLPHRFVEGIIETRAGDLWIATPRGLSRVTAAGGSARFVNYPLEPVSGAISFGGILESRTGKILAGTNKGLFESSTDASGSIHFRRSTFPGLDSVVITDLAEDSAGNLWVATTTGVLVYAGSGSPQKLGVKDALPGEWAQVLITDSRGGVWVGVRGGVAHLRRDNDGKWVADQVYDARSGLVGTDVQALLEASDGIVWVGTSLGISRITPGPDGKPRLENITRKQGLSDRTVIAFAEDQAGNVWAGTEHAGAMRIDRAGFTTYREPDGLLSDRVFAVLEDHEGTLLAVSSGVTQKSHRLAVFDGSRFHNAAVPRFTETPTWGWSQILLQSRAGEWWGATDRGLCRYGSGKPDALGGRPPKACYTDDAEFRIFEDSTGGIWASGQTRPGNRLIRWDPTTNQVTIFPAQKVPGVVLDDLVSSFAEDRQGNIWMGLWVGGLYRYDGHSFEYFRTSDGVPGGTVFALFPQGDILWIGSNGGLGRILNTAEKKPRIDKITTAQGLSSDIVYCITSDAQGRIYAGTGKGVDRLEATGGHIRHFSAADGLPHGALRSAFRDRNGSLWFATTQGLSKLVTTGDRAGFPPRVLITDLRAGGGARPVSQLGEARVGHIELTPSANQLSVEFVGLDYEPGGALLYSYKLEGADGGWSPPRSQHSVDFAALASGSYRFLVKAINSDGIESTAPAEVDLTVLPPFWRRWWFEALALAAVVSFVYALHSYRVAQVVGMERMRTAIATDLHDDIGSSLSQIAVLSEVARAGVGPENHRTHESLERVAVLSRELVDSMGDIVWSIRAAPDGLDSLVSRMREFALDLLAGQGIEFQLQSPESVGNVHLSLGARRHLFLIFKECLHNASRHSGCTLVKACLEAVDQEVRLSIEDNGRGFPPEDAAAERRRGGNGILNIRRRAEALGGCVEIRSSPGEGLSIRVVAPFKPTRFAGYRFE